MTERATPRWLDVLWLIFLGGLALIPPVAELHKQLILLIIGISQLLETQFVRRAGIDARARLFWHGGLDRRRPDL